MLCLDSTDEVIEKANSKNKRVIFKRKQSISDGKTDSSEDQDVMSVSFCVFLFIIYIYIFYKIHYDLIMLSERNIFFNILLFKKNNSY